MMGGMSKEWKPPKEDADVFAQYKAHVEGERELKPEMEKLADRALAAGATVGQLARQTGLTPEVFRRRARKLGIELKRPPTVGRLTPEGASVPERPSTAAPRQQARKAVPEPSADNAFELTAKETKHMLRLAYARATDKQPERLHLTAKTAKSLGRDPDLAVLDAAFEMGLVKDADVVAVREHLAAEQPDPDDDATEER